MDIFLTIMLWHVRAAHLQFLRALEIDIADNEGDLHDGLTVSSDLGSGKNDGVSYELGIGYPTLQSIMSGIKNILTIKVMGCYILCYIT